MGGWYWIGALTGVGVALGVLVAGLAPRGILAAAVAAAVGAAIGVAVFDWGEAVGAGVGGIAGGFGASPVIRGALGRGGTRGGLAVLGGVGAAAATALAFVPALGYLEAVALPAVALRLRSKTPQRHAGLRILARD